MPILVGIENYLLRNTLYAAVDKQIQAELDAGRYVITTEKPTIISALGAIRKPDGVHVRLIQDYSMPRGKSVNDYAAPRQKQKLHTCNILPLGGYTWLSVIFAMPTVVSDCTHPNMRGGTYFYELLMALYFF